MTSFEPARTLSRPRVSEARAPESPASWREGDFEAALRRAQERRPEQLDEKAPRRSERPEDESRADAGSVPPGVERTEAHVFPAEDKGELRSENVAGGPPPLPGASEPAAVQSPAGVANLDAFAAAMEQAALNAAADKSKQVQVTFPDAGPLSGLSLARGPDGAFTVQLVAHSHAVPQVNRALEPLKRRLLDRGLPVAEVRMERNEAAPEPITGRRA